MVLLKCILQETGCEAVNWIYMAQVRV